MNIQFDVEIDIKVNPTGSTTQRVESFTIPVTAGSFAEAQELAFTKIRESGSFEHLMNTLTLGLGRKDNA